MKVYVQQEGQLPRVVSDTFAELPTVPNVGVNGYLESRTDFASAAPGTIAFVKEFKMEFVFDGVSWSSYTDYIVGLSSTTKPLNPPDGAKFKEVDSGTLYESFGGTWYAQP